jgi:hypothetical protein
MNSAENDGRESMWSDEARVRRFMNLISFTRCVVGPLVLFGLLVGSIYWEPAAESAHAAYFPAQYANAASAAEDHVQAF